MSLADEDFADFDKFMEERENKKLQKVVTPYPTDNKGEFFENKSGSKKKLKRTAKKGNKVAQAIRSWGSTQEFCVNNPAYEPLEEDFWREYCNLLRN